MLDATIRAAEPRRVGDARLAEGDREEERLLVRHTKQGALQDYGASLRPEARGRAVSVQFQDDPEFRADLRGKLRRQNPDLTEAEVEGRASFSVAFSVALTGPVRAVHSPASVA